MFDLLILSGSNGKNLELSLEIEKIAKSMDLKTSLVDLVDLNLPLYTPVEERNGIPNDVEALVDQIKKAKSLFVIAPEYNGSIPPVLNNAIAWVSRTGEDWREAFNGKMTAIGTHSGGGGLHVLAAMRGQFSYLGANVIGRQLQTNFSKKLSPDSAKSILEQIKKYLD